MRNKLTGNVKIMMFSVHCRVEPDKLDLSISQLSIVCGVHMLKTGNLFPHTCSAFSGLVDDELVYHNYLILNVNLKLSASF